jgi:hypothetical protein
MGCNQPFDFMIVKTDAPGSVSFLRRRRLVMMLMGVFEHPGQRLDETL